MAILTGMKDIQKQVNMSEASVLAWIRDAGFPAKKIGGVWISETEAISRWCARLIEDNQSSQELILNGKRNKEKKKKRQ